MTAIVYCSQTGHTAQYAKLLGQRLGKPAYDMASAPLAVAKGADVVFLSWLRAGSPKGFQKAAALWKIVAMAVVGMPDDGGAQLPAVARTCGLSPEFPLFYLPGGYEPDKLKGASALAMGLMGKSMIRKLEAIPNPTEAQQALLDLWRHGGNLVDVRHLAALANWCQAHCRDQN